MMMNRGSRILGLRSGNHVAEHDEERAEALEHAPAPERVPAPERGPAPERVTPPEHAPEARATRRPPPPVEEPEIEELEEELDEAPLGRGGWILPTLGTLVSLGWIGGMLWLAWPKLQSTPPMELAGFVAALCTPPALICVLLLLRLRTSAAEARRFGETSRAMRAEAAALERTVSALARAIDENRARLAEQASALAALSDAAATTVAQTGSEMARHVAMADERTRSIANAAEAARNNVSILLATLPKVHGETADMARLLEKAGVTASEQATALDAQLTTLAERGRVADTIASGAAQKLADHLTRMESTSETAGARLEAVTGEMSAAVDGLLGRTAQAVDEARKGIAAQGEAMLAMVGTNQAALDRAGHDSAEALAKRIAAIEEVIDRIAARLTEQRVTGQEVITELDTGFAKVSDRLEAFHTQGIDRTQSLAASISALSGTADTMAEALRNGDALAVSAIGNTERLLTALDAATREIDETLPAALARLDGRISDSRQVLGEAKPELLALVTAAEATHDAVEGVAHVLSGQRASLDKLSSTLGEILDTSRAKADAVSVVVEETIGRSHRFSDDAAPRLIDALLRVGETAGATADRAREALATVIPDAALALEQASADAMRRASSTAVEQQIAQLAEAGEAAVEAAQRLSERLARQMLAITDSTAVIESRIEEARAEREEADEATFARRVSQLIESLNSASIDITKTFSTEVSDGAWSAYLKGDRGVFTRRAVRLLDAGEAREIHRLYDEDASFREQVNRYIHDFEAMLRAILAQRDGAPIGVTLLSSDMGKLYVALAQAIERLRT